MENLLMLVIAIVPSGSICPVGITTSLVTFGNTLKTGLLKTKIANIVLVP